MIDKKKTSLSALKEKTASRLPSLDKVDVKGKALKTGEAIGGKAMEIKESAIAKKEDITEKLTAGGGGIAAGNALLAMAGPVGWRLSGCEINPEA